MPTRKQRRRRAKEQRHEYVWEDAEGNELDPEEVPTKASKSDRSDRGRRSSRPARVPQAPSWNKTFKRGLIFAPIMFVTVMLLSNNLSTTQQVTQTLFIVAIFIPFSYFLDRVFWRSHQKRMARQQDAGRARGS